MLVFLSVILMNLFDFYYASCIHFVETRAILIQKKLISLMANNDSASLMLLKGTSIELWHLSEMLNERFAYTLLMTVTSKLVIFVIDIYWVYIRIIHSVYDFDFIRKYQLNHSFRMFHNKNFKLVFLLQAAFLFCVHPVISLIGIFCSCSFATNEYKNISSALHKLSSRDTHNSVLLRQVEGFSLQLMTTKMQFTAKGFFEISNKTLREVKVINLHTAVCGFKLISPLDVVSFCDVFFDYHSVHAKMGCLSSSS